MINLNGNMHVVIFFIVFVTYKNDKDENDRDVIEINDTNIY